MLAACHWPDAALVPPPPSAEPVRFRRHRRHCSGLRSFVSGAPAENGPEPVSDRRAEPWGRNRGRVRGHAGGRGADLHVAVGMPICITLNMQIPGAAPGSLPRHRRLFPEQGRDPGALSAAPPPPPGAPCSGGRRGMDRPVHRCPPGPAAPRPQRWPDSSLWGREGGAPWGAAAAAARPAFNWQRGRRRRRRSSQPLENTRGEAPTATAGRLERPPSPRAQPPAAKPLAKGRGEAVKGRGGQQTLSRAVGRGTAGASPPPLPPAPTWLRAGVGAPGARERHARDGAPPPSAALTSQAGVGVGRGRVAMGVGASAWVGAGLAGGSGKGG
uniref:Uncharacterized protein n=1 Tax=Sphaerodactylus townsendi TaxID=933632 RepID=A0ACB8EES5_9SAUR